jgi:hypothetical protein
MSKDSTELVAFLSPESPIIEPVGAGKRPAENHRKLRRNLGRLQAFFLPETGLERK